MHAFIPRSAVVVRIPDEDEDKEEHRFFLDSAYPHSFSRHLPQLNAGHLPGVGSHWTPLNLSPRAGDLANLGQAEAALGLDLCGILGWDFFVAARCLSINVIQRTLTFGGAATGTTLSLQAPWNQWPPRTGNVGGAQSSLIDTGSGFCLSQAVPASPYAPSTGWVLPTLSGLMTPDLYAAVSLTVGGLQVSATVGWPQSWPQGLNACDFVLGQSVLARYCVTFDGANGLVGLIPQTPPAPSSSDPVFIEPGLHHVGVQVRWRGGQFEVINVLPWSPNRGNVKPGDILTLPGVALTGPEAINVLDRTLSSSGPGHVVVEVGGQAVQMALAPVF